MSQTSPVEARSSKLAQVNLGPHWGWSEVQLAHASISVKGHVFDGQRTLEGESAGRFIVDLLAGLSGGAAIESALAVLSGHFAFVLQTPHFVLASVDRIRSVPLFYGVRSGKLLLDDRATRLRDTLGLGTDDLDSTQVLAVAMCGYTIGGSSIYRGLDLLRPGEALLIEPSGTRALRWFVYDAWHTEGVTKPERRLSELNRFLIERLKTSAGDRPICVPLSAGYDSRFIAAGLKEAGARNVRLFSYGRPGNHEIKAAQVIAGRLGYPWRMVPFTTRSQQAMFADAAHEDALWGVADSCCSVPFEQDWRAIEVLRRDGFIPPDAVIVNGQTGDFISGNHAPPQLMSTPASESAEARSRRVYEAFLAKHGRLWSSLATPANDALLAEVLAGEARRAGATFSQGEALHGIHEMLEYESRQAKYVVSGQRTYEAQGLAWRLPLWDDEYIQFWRRAPAELKRGQNLYRRVLERDNWAGVFDGIPVNRKTITPAWIRPIRLSAKLACAPFGQDRWHSVEQRLFGWWMDPLRAAAVVPYWRALSDARGARNPVSWLAERWLAKHGISLADPAKGPLVCG